MTNRAMQQLAEMRHLFPNWDSYGAKMIDRAAIAKAQGMLPQLSGDWQAVPCSDGSVQLELHADGFDIEIHISNAHPTYECSYCHGNDRDAPCAYPSEGKPGCLRDERLAKTERLCVMR